jgi:hypothetical protein
MSINCSSVSSFVVLDNNRFMARSGNREVQITRDEAVSLYKAGVYMRDARHHNVLDSVGLPTAIDATEYLIEHDVLEAIGGSVKNAIINASNAHKSGQKSAFRQLATKWAKQGELYRTVCNRAIGWELVKTGNDGALYHDYRGWLAAHGVNPVHESQKKASDPAMGAGFFVMATCAHEVIVEGLPGQASDAANKIATEHKATVSAIRPNDSIYGQQAIRYVVSW